MTPDRQSCDDALILRTDGTHSLHRVVTRLRRELPGAPLALVHFADPAAAIRALDELQRQRPGTPTLVVEPHGSPEARLRILRAGADECVSEPALDDEVLLRAGRLLGCRIERPLIVGDLVVDRARHQASRAGRALHLTPTEFAVLAVLAQQAGRVVARRELHERVWGHDLGRESKTLAVYVGYLRRKLRLPALIHTVRGVGYCLEDRRRHGNALGENG